MINPNEKQKQGDASGQPTDHDDASLTLDKETLQDLEVPADRQDEVKGATLINCQTRLG